MTAQPGPPLIQVLLFEPGHGPRLVEVKEDCEAYQELLDAEETYADCFQVGDRCYAMWYDEEGTLKNRTPNRRLTGPYKYAGGVMRGPFFVARVRGDRETGVDDSDLPYIRRFVEF
jgi:hypothetical protein